ncbi:hypothetical protein HFO58_07745 [Rhizobium leguminosarum]|uniref:hypothetical protein n=1 Tax=Rhizobium leguminosarum TaxID=384 RepID=UPI001C9649BC|nr:hypothetical protein [Rhizobium leguminosarum]MBY5533062.1 hypothetical protein [Rhizobium leguminosarum]
MSSDSTFPTTQDQLRLDLQVAAEREIDGVGMGVLSDGTPFLTIRGLARMCGIDHTMIVKITADWIQTPLRPREQKIRELVRAQGADDSIAFIALQKAGNIYHAIPAAVCMAILEYYAFEARSDNPQASHSFRTLARKGFGDYIYSLVGYNPSGSVSIAWQQFHDRVTVAYHTVPDGYFSIFKEVADILVTLIREGADLGSHFVPDISVGQRWARFWKDNNLEVLYGERRQYEHNYPHYFPQAPSNPQPAYCYPDDALGEFRKWVRQKYVPDHLPQYLNTKVSQGHIPAPKAAAAITALAPKRLQ